MQDPQSERESQRRSWERFYSENERPWRGIGRVDGLDAGPGCRALDVGCGNGKTVAALLRTGAEVTGLDFSAAAVDLCRKRWSGAGFVVGDCTRMPFGDGAFDIVTLVHVLEHLDGEQLRQTAAETVRVLADGGRVLVRSFAVGDMRAAGTESNVRGNGIRYRYLTREAVEGLFAGLEVTRSETVEETMRFGGVRVRAECIFRKGAGDPAKNLNI